ncbi:hypothetical protein [Novosphingobium colocasiae]|uniref:hypothetical protein n=1 Tax=Novosphingobium colocasiae TaxID=1256513 RepID=UPI001674F8EF|nr:hypothetical protein [Novosphingobium colocasiae]
MQGEAEHFFIVQFVVQARSMHRLTALILMCLVSLSLMAGTVAHAAEPIGCLDSDVAAGLGHAAGDRDQVPSDDGKATPHHHGGCHGHQIGEPVNEAMAPQRHLRDSRPMPIDVAARVSAPTNPAYRPPRA